MELTYTLKGDYLYPNLALEPEEPMTLGKYGSLRRSFLREHRYPAYQALMVEGLLNKHLMEIDQRAKASNAQREIIEKIAAEGPCVIVGRRADRILADKANVFSVFVCGSKEVRAKHVAEREHTSIKEAAQKIAKADRERMMYYNQFAGAHWGDPAGYDLCVNTDGISFEMAADSIARLAQNV